MATVNGDTPPPQSAPVARDAPLLPWQLDLDKLHALPMDQQGLSLLNHVVKLEQQIREDTPEQVSRHQAVFKDEILKIVTLKAPSTNRPVRNALGRSLEGLLDKGFRNALSACVNDLLAVVNAGKEVDLKAKHAAVYCLGVIFGTTGPTLSNLLEPTHSALTKALKVAANDAGLRAAIHCALGKVVQGSSSLSEDIARAIWKQARNAATGERVYWVQVSACDCLDQLVRCTSYFQSASDFERLQLALAKVMESPSFTARQAATCCLASAFGKAWRAPKSADSQTALQKRPTSHDEEDAIGQPDVQQVIKSTAIVSYSITDILKQILTLYVRPATSNRVRAALLASFEQFTHSLTDQELEDSYADISSYLVIQFLNHNLIHVNRYRYLITRKLIIVMLKQSIHPRLGESAQLGAIRHLLTIINAKDVPRWSLYTATGAMTSLIASLGGAVSIIAPECRESILAMLGHSNFAVQVQSCIALKALMLAWPQELLYTTNNCFQQLQTHLVALATSIAAARQCVGYANAMCSLLSAAAKNTLFGDAKTYADIMADAMTLLKSASSSELRISACQVQVAWTLIAGVMQLGAGFAKVHLPQLLLVWKNTLAKPASKDDVRRRPLLELSYLSHIRECALTALLSFLLSSPRLLTIEITRRLGLLLEGTAMFLQSLPERTTSEDPATRLSPAFQLYDYKKMTWRRLYQCFGRLNLSTPHGGIEISTHSTILTSAITFICSAEHDDLKPSSSVASSLSVTNEIWTVGDDFGAGVSSFVSSTAYRRPLDQTIHAMLPSAGSATLHMDLVVQTPTCSVPENDPMCCFLDEDASPPASTGVVDAALTVFTLSFPLQMPKVQQSMLEQMSSALLSTDLLKDPERKTASSLNTSLAILSISDVFANPPASWKRARAPPASAVALQDLLRILLSEPEDIVRSMAGTALGTICSLMDSDYTAGQVKWLTDTIINDRTPATRAGCAVTLASIHAHLGSMAAGLHLRHIVGILSSLAADTHPLVHFWAMESLNIVANSAGLNYAAYVSSSVGLLSQIYILDDHNQEVASIASSNMIIDKPVVAGIAHALSALIDVLGPDLQDMHKTRELIVMMVSLMGSESDHAVVQATLKSEEALSLYMPNLFELEPYVRKLQRELSAADYGVRRAAIDGLRNVMRRNAENVIRMALPGLETQLWDLLDSPLSDIVQTIFRTWLQQTALDEPDVWITRCSNVLSRTKTSSTDVKPITDLAVDLQDEDVAGLASNGEPAKDESGAVQTAPEYLRWQVRLFALECLEHVILVIAEYAAKHGDTPSLAMLQHRIGDVIRVAFSASTAGVTALRLLGLRIIDQILQLFGKTPDPDFAEAMLLEQYQAQITSALTPAFAADSSPALAAEAISVCATFLSTGIVTDVDRMGRILKVLVTALDDVSESVDQTTIGEMKTVSRNAQIMFRTSVFSAWAALQVASVEQKYLIQVVTPLIPRMVPLWLETLKEHARLRYEPEIAAHDLDSGDIDDVYASFNRHTLLSYYQDIWLSLVNAIASLIDQNSQVVFEALDGRIGNSHTNGTSIINYRDEPVAFFFVLFGLTFEAIATHQSKVDAGKINLLHALRKILRPSVAGTAAYQPSIFAELMDMMDRMALTDSVSVQTAVVEIATDLCMAHPSSRQEDRDTSSDTLSEDIEQLFELTRIVFLVLGDIIPGISETPSAVRIEPSDESDLLVHTALQALVDISDVFPAIIRTDLRDAILHIFVVMLGTGACQAVMVPQSLPMFRRLVASMAEQPLPHTDRQLSNALARMLATLSKAQQQDTELSLACQKNVLLASALLVGSTSKLMGEDGWILQQYIEAVKGALGETAVSRVAVGCLRTMLFAGIAQKRLLTISLDFLAASDPAVTEGQMLMLQTLTAYAARASASQQPPLFTVLLSAILDWAQRQDSTTESEVASRVLDLSQANGQAFRYAFAVLGVMQKQLMQKLLQEKMGGRGRSTESNELEPTIALKFDFGK